MRLVIDPEIFEKGQITFLFMSQWLKNILPERIPAFAAILYSLVPARMFGPHYRMIAEEISLKNNDVLIDLGTGPGLLPLEIAKRFPGAKVIGIDLSEKMIEIANKNKMRDGRTRGTEFRVMDAGALEFNDNSLDMVISTGAMHHWKDPAKIINEVYRCLKPGAEAWIYDGYGNATNEAIAQSVRPVIPGTPRCLIRRILGVHGFSQVEYDTKIKDMVAKTRFKTCLFENRGIMMRVRFRK
jgi:SAM-dependent methyltransferase